MTREDFEARCQYTQPGTTPLAWFERQGDAAIGLVFRDHSTTTFVAATLVAGPAGYRVDSRVEGLDERSVAIAQVLELLVA